MGWHVHESLQTKQVAQALKMALKGSQSRQALVHHSDRGVQHCATYYQRLHQRHGLTCSMPDGYACYQNALAERVNGILKGELLLQRPADLVQARRMVAPHIIDKGIPTTRLLAQVLVAKYLDHLPLYRQEAIFERAGMAVARSTLAQGSASAACNCSPSWTR